MRIAVVLSGCGYLDGAEVRESVLTLLYLDQQNASVECFAPDVPQADVVNHLSGEPKEDFRGVLEESARIARGKVQNLEALDVSEYDALLLPGGFGAAKNWSNFAVKGAECTVNSELDRVIHGFFDQKKPIGAMCIAPAVLAASLKGKGLTLTIGEDKDVAQAIESLGHTHTNTPSNQACVDEPNRIATCSAYMREDPIADIAEGIEELIITISKLVNQQPLSKAS